MPAGLAARVKPRAAAARQKFGWALAATAASIALIVAAGLLAKQYAPSLFADIQRSIMGAASASGSGGGK